PAVLCFAQARHTTGHRAVRAPAPSSLVWPPMENWKRMLSGCRKASSGAHSKVRSPGWIARPEKSRPASPVPLSSTPKVCCCSTNWIRSAGAFAMSRPYDVIIVGAGIVGAACAAECANGGLKVLVIDRGPIAGGTTGAGMGHLVVMDDSEAQFALTSFSVSLWHELAPRLPVDVEYDPCGTLWLAADQDEMVEVKRKQKHYSDRGVRVEVLDETTVHQAEPNLRAGMAGGLLVAGDAVLYPPCAARYLLDQAKAKGAELRLRVSVREFLAEGGIVLGDGSRISAGHTVSATGPWSPELSPGLPVRKRKGHLLITDRYPGFVHHQIVE